MTITLKYEIITTVLLSQEQWHLDWTLDGCFYPELKIRAHIFCDDLKITEDKERELLKGFTFSVHCNDRNYLTETKQEAMAGLQSFFTDHGISVSEVFINCSIATTHLDIEIGLSI